LEGGAGRRHVVLRMVCKTLTGSGSRGVVVGETRSIAGRDHELLFASRTLSVPTVGFEDW
jgi:hypothetical protein